MIGKIHSTESFGTVDGPGIRFVVFMQGCPMRCKYCHNPDTWELNAGKEMTVEQLLNEYSKCREFYKDGGITVTGGEPLIQMDFVTELLESAKGQGIHTCIDTSGITFTPENTEKFDRLIQSVDLVMLDIKHIDSELHKELTGQENKRILAFAEYLAEKNVPVWIRHVVVPSITTEDKHLYELGRFIGKLKNVKALDVLPYHVMGVSKYDALGMDYPLKGVDPATEEQALNAKKAILRGIKDFRTGK